MKLTNRHDIKLGGIKKTTNVLYKFRAGDEIYKILPVSRSGELG